MKNTLLVSIIVLFQAFSILALGMSCRNSELSLEESNTYLDVKKLSPYSPMKWTSLIGSVTGVFLLSSNNSNNDNREIPEWVTGTSVLLWSTTALLMMMETCPVKLHSDARSENTEISNKVESRLIGLRQSFLAIHAFNSLPLLLAAPYSSRSDRAYIVVGGIVLPGLVDLVVRGLFNSHKVSPWSLRPGLVIHRDRPVGSVAFNYSW